MVDAERRDARDRGGRDDVGGVEPPAKPDLDNAVIGGDAGKGKEGGGRGHLKEARAQPFRFVEHLFEQRRKQRVVDQRPGKANAFVEPDEVRAGVAVDAAPLRFEDRAQIGTGRSLAVGARDMEGAWELELWIAEARAEFGDAFEAEDVA